MIVVAPVLHVLLYELLAWVARILTKVSDPIGDNQVFYAEFTYSQIGFPSLLLFGLSNSFMDWAY